MAVVQSQGVQLQLGDGASPEVFTSVGQVTNVSGLRGGQATVIDTTNLSSTRREKTMGLPDEGQVTVSLHYDPSDAQHTQMEVARAGRTLTNFKLTLPTTPVTEFAFSGFVLTFPINNALDTVVQGDVTIEITGEVVKSTV